MLTLLINLNESNILQVHFAKTARAVLGIVGNAGGNAGNGGENAGIAGGNAGNWHENVVFIALAKIPEREVSISPSNFHGQLPDY